jgi:hypothetical protein
LATRPAPSASRAIRRNCIGLPLHNRATARTIVEITYLEAAMMNDMMNSGGMMWGMGFVGLLVTLVLILAAAALIKYLFFR